MAGNVSAEGLALDRFRDRSEADFVIFERTAPHPSIHDGGVKAA
jgi:hypothetical protein